MSAAQTFRLPGLVDIHVHLRDPGQTHKEDFYSGTSAALAGGFTQVFDMPNNATPVVTPQALDEKLAIARRMIVCDVGFYYGSLGGNTDTFQDVQDRVCGLKLYLNETTGGYRIDADYLIKIFSAWHCKKPVMMHAETDVIGAVLSAASKTGQNVHICHVSSRAELEPILVAKRAGLAVTCGVTPHHLFLTDQDGEQLGYFGSVKPVLKPQADVDYLWEHFDEIDVVESDHAPHIVAEKAQGAYGLPGLETTLPLMLQAAQLGRLRRADIVAKLSTAPRRIMGIAEDPHTYIEVEPVEFEFSPERMKSRAAWTPFSGRIGFGRVKRVILRGVAAFSDGVILAGSGRGEITTNPPVA